MSLKSKTRIFWFFIFLCFLAAFSMCLYSLWLNQSESMQLIKKDHTSQKAVGDLIALSLSDSQKTRTNTSIEVDEKRWSGQLKK